MKNLIRFTLVFTLAVFGVFFVSANHSFSIHSPQICLNGASFRGNPSSPDSFNLSMVGQIFNLNPSLVASGNTHTFQDYGENFQFLVQYPEGTFNVGDKIVYSASDIAGDLNGNEGAYEFATVRDCLIDFSTTSVALDNRINRFDSAAPVAVYFVSGSLEIWAIQNSEGTLLMTFSQAELEAASGLVASEAGIELYALGANTYLIRAGMSNGKTYVLSFSGFEPNASYTSYEE